MFASVPPHQRTLLVALLIAFHACTVLSIQCSTTKDSLFSHRRRRSLAKSTRNETRITTACLLANANVMPSGCYGMAPMYYRLPYAQSDGRQLSSDPSRCHTGGYVRVTNQPTCCSTCMHRPTVPKRSVIHCQSTHKRYVPIPLLLCQTTTATATE
jgi:hypothetical protein